MPLPHHPRDWERRPGGGRRGPRLLPEGGCSRQRPGELALHGGRPRYCAASARRRDGLPRGGRPQGDRQCPEHWGRDLRQRGRRLCQGQRKRGLAGAAADGGARYPHRSCGPAQSLERQGLPVHHPAHKRGLGGIPGVVRGRAVCKDEPADGTGALRAGRGDHGLPGGVPIRRGPAAKAGRGK